MLRRRHLLAGLGASFGTALAGSAYALAIEPGFRLEARHYRPALPAWPDGFRLRVGIITDLHAGGPHMLPRRVEGIVEAMEGLRPDLVVILGDLNASHRFLTERVPPLRSAAILARLRPPLGVHAVLGNHDWWDDPQAFRLGRRHRPETERALLAAGIPVLENTAVRLRHDGRHFWLAGLGSMWAFGGGLGRWRGIDDLSRTLTALADDAPAILLAHEPDIFPRVPARVALTLSGHTHGGQVRLPGVPLRIPSNYGDRYAYGHIVEGGRHLIVSAGLGTSGYPIRFGAPPEIVLVELGQAGAG
jgi:predicted MPP superfamily phosphohydrolase